MEDSGISSLRPGGSAPELEVRVVRCWKPVFRDNEVCYVFVDKEGIGIQAMAKGRDQRSVTSKLQVHKCYKIKGYACVEPDKYTSTLSHPAYMRVGSATVFTLMPDSPDFPDQYFEFVNRQRLDALHTKSRDPNQAQNRMILDYIGILQRMEDNVTNNRKPYVTVTLRDCSNQNVTIRLWEEIATSAARLPRIAIEASSNPTILALTALRLTDFLGKLQLQSTNATHVYVNPSTVETRSLLNMFDNVPPEQGNTETHQQQPQQQAGAEVPNTTISQLQAMEPKQLKGRNFILKASVTELQNDREWHCIGCPKCDQSLLKVGDEWFCSMHGDLSLPTEIYRITAIISTTQDMPLL